MKREDGRAETFLGPYRGTSLIRNSAPLGTYRRTIPRLHTAVLGGVAVSYERGTLVLYRVGL